MYRAQNKTKSIHADIIIYYLLISTLLGWPGQYPGVHPIYNKNCFFHSYC